MWIALFASLISCVCVWLVAPNALRTKVLFFANRFFFFFVCSSYVHSRF